MKTSPANSHEQRYILLRYRRTQVKMNKTVIQITNINPINIMERKALQKEISI
jgi:hypothetical protein